MVTKFLPGDFSPFLYFPSYVFLWSAFSLLLVISSDF